MKRSSAIKLIAGHILNAGNYCANYDMCDGLAEDLLNDLENVGMSPPKVDEIFSWEEELPILPIGKMNVTSQQLSLEYWAEMQPLTIKKKGSRFYPRSPKRRV